MILPQSQTFNVLKTRLDCVNITNFSLPFINAEEEIKEDKEVTKQFIIQCLSQYDIKQEKLKLYQSKMESNSKNNPHNMLANVGAYKGIYVAKDSKQIKRSSIVNDSS